METTSNTLVMPYAHLEMFAEELLCAEHLASSLVDLVQLTLGGIMLPETDPPGREEIRLTQSTLGCSPRKNCHLMHI